ncbi:uracil-DNA glycosylase superfamily protein (macronuclear) [Tetrahymena thermophila SB210]|uniref:Uracil-DNA glycosylase n=1 Tax=Tetrahymena thermophila (strain SB210) TaxID=312017 RepID=Q23W06_TETTS|nr:uracil-DNA glycosylase superfamily protein [Tetrahymena thermophila SB210]EAS00699.3 uracil-DNA glycosylase superfamily protein [Tetrahymena thermophila SB210]|eukprot:XP_001020944.3 uracil-DNA glycosylase superfamily protein [Tetrahymena thermophila SB210]
MFIFRKSSFFFQKNLILNYSIAKIPQQLTAQMSQKNMTDYFKAKPEAKEKPKKKVAKNEMEEEEEVKVDKVEKKEKLAGEFPTFDEFQDDLCSWKDILGTYIKSQKFKSIYTFVKKEYADKTCYPPAHEIFNVFKQTPLNTLKVVIVGQDPYHQPGQAMGLCFSVKKGVKPPPSLVNIYKSLSNDPKIKGFKTPNHGDLTKWANQGVFLLNDIMTVEYDKPASHSKSGWADFTSEVIKIINKECKDIVFLLWGKPAQKKASIVDTKKHHVLATSHPSPLGYMKGFDKANCFSACNEILVKLGKEPIDWQV